MKWYLKIILVLLVGVFFFSCYRIVLIYSEYKEGNEEYQNLDQYTEKEPTKPEETSYTKRDEIETDEQTLTIDFEELKQKNPDIIGWIYIPLLEISYPVVKCDNNEYYLNRTFEKNSNSCGCIFADCQNNSDFSDYNTFVYGHNMKNGSMFGSLKRYLREEDLYHEDPYFYIYTEDFVYQYMIYSCYVTEPDSQSYRFTNTNEEYQKYLTEVIEKSSVKCNTIENKNENTVTLSTCYGSGEQKKRLLIHGISVKCEKNF